MSSPTTQPRWGTIPQAAEHVGLSAKTIRRRIADGTIAAKRLGPRRILVDLDALDAAGTPIGGVVR